MNSFRRPPLLVGVMNREKPLIEELVGKPDYEAFEMTIQAGFHCSCIYNEECFFQTRLKGSISGVVLLINEKGFVKKAKFIFA